MTDKKLEKMFGMNAENNERLMRVSLDALEPELGKVLHELCVKAAKFAQEISSETIIRVLGLNNPNQEFTVSVVLSHIMLNMPRAMAEQFGVILAMHETMFDVSEETSSKLVELSNYHFTKGVVDGYKATKDKQNQKQQKGGA